MGNNYIQDIKNFIGSISFKVFLWSINMDKDEYIREIENEAFVHGFNRGWQEKCPKSK